MLIYADKVFENPVETIEAFSPDQVKPTLDKIESLKNKGLYLVGYMRYNLKSAEDNLPLVYFEAYYTYPSSLKTNASEIDLYHFLLQNQRTPYNAFLQNKYETILSFSPELFFTLNGNKILTKPMKGTVKRGENSEEDAKLKDFLFNDLKNRTENIMIVDLLRNDLGRISKPGTVRADNTEGTFTSIGVKLNGIIYTPPIKCGLLNGITRQKLLREGKIQEKILYPHDLETAEKIYCFNSVRGVVEVELA